MGTTKKRIQVLLPSRIALVVERLAEEMECSQSRVVSRLCDEALLTRGEFQGSNPKQEAIHEAVPVAGATVEQIGVKQFLDNAGVDFQTTATNTRNTAFQAARMNVLHEMPPEPEPEETPAAIEDDDLRLLKKLKLLKELGLL